VDKGVGGINFSQFCVEVFCAASNDIYKDAERYRLSIEVFSLFKCYRINIFITELLILGKLI